MFDPKSSNLLDEQLAVSGLEMSVFGAIAAVASVAGGIMGAVGASKSNAAAKAAQKKQEKFNKKVAENTNKYNDELDEADKANYHAMRDYSYETSIKNWNRGKELQNFAFAQEAKKYEKSLQITSGQIGLNQEAAQQGIMGEQASIEDMFIQQQFQGETSLGALKDAYIEQAFSIREENTKLLGIRSKRNLRTAAITSQIDTLMTAGSLQKQASLVEGLLAEGKASLGQAGKSRIKGKQSAAAALQRGLIGLEAELTGKRKQAGIELAQLNAETSLAITGVGLNLEKINNAIESAEGEAEYNGRIMSANVESAINQSQRNVEEILQQKKYTDLNTIASMMLRPEFAGYDPKPEKPPERIFVDRMEAIPGFVPPAAQQNVWAPLISGVASAASGLSSAVASGGEYG